MVELAADMIKAFYTGEKFFEIVDNTPVPVFTIGADRLPNDLEVLKKAKASIDAGARGIIIFGRNIFMAKNPQNLIKALKNVMNKNSDIEETYNKYNLN
jgi:DhnA family fructose-bisphosphate aldolase class Ia